MPQSADISDSCCHEKEKNGRHNDCMLADALRRLESKKCNNCSIFAFESTNGTRQYEIMTTEQAWNMSMSKQPNCHMYEVLSTICNMYLDVEWYANQEESENVQQAQIKLITQHLQQALLVQYGETDVQLFTASASGFLKNGKYKSSWHIHARCSSVCWANAAAVGQFVKKVFSSNDKVDKVPYAFCGQNWRCVGSSKANDSNRFFRPVTKENFLNCLVQESSRNRKIVHAEVSVNQTVSFMPVPEYVKRLAAELDSSTEPMMCCTTICVLPFRDRQFCEHVGRKHRSNHQYAVIDVKALVWKMKCHGCPLAPGMWQVFENQTLIEQIVAEQLQDYATNVVKPMVSKHSKRPSKLIYDLRTVGPPPVCNVNVMCKDGTYVSST